jgi:opacity protein-like surface antigen
MSNRASIFCSFALTASAAIGAASHAKAADLGSFFGAPQEDQQADAPTQPVEFGTGWYIRGSVGGAVQAMPDLLSDPNNVGFTQKLNWFVEAGAGYQINQWFRTDATYTYYGSQPMSGEGAAISCATSLSPVNDPTTGDVIATAVNTNQCSSKESASVQKNLFLANGYVDLGTYWGVTPYIGAGVGTAYLNASQTVNVLNPDGTPYRAVLTMPAVFSVPLNYTNPLTGQLIEPQPHYNTGVQNLDYSESISKWNFAFALMAGFSYDISQNLKLDLGYRYVNFGSLSFKSLLGSAFDKNLTSQEVRLGLRYIVD